MYVLFVFIFIVALNPSSIEILLTLFQELNSFDSRVVSEIELFLSELNLTDIAVCIAKNILRGAINKSLEMEIGD